MKCTYCNSETHMEIDCPSRRSERRIEKTMGWFFVCLLFPFWLIGAVAGAIRGAMKAGAEFCGDAWPESRKWTGAKKDEEISRP